MGVLRGDVAGVWCDGRDTGGPEGLPDECRWADDGMGGTHVVAFYDEWTITRPSIASLVRACGTDQPAEWEFASLMRPPAPMLNTSTWLELWRVGEIMKTIGGG